MDKITVERSLFELLAKYYQDHHCAICSCENSFLVLNSDNDKVCNSCLGLAVINTDDEDPS